MRRRGFLFTVVACFAGAAAWTQAQPGAFLSDSIARSTSPGGSFTVDVNGRRVSASNITLRELIRVAYGDMDFLDATRVVEGPAWIDVDRFDVTGTVEGRNVAMPGGGTTDFARLEMKFGLQFFLAEHFKLRMRRGTQRPLPTYELVSEDGKFGPQLRRAESCRAAPPIDRPNPRNQPPATPLPCIESNARGRFVFNGMPLWQLFEYPALGNEVRRTVYDRTGLDGFFSGSLEWTPTSAPPSPWLLLSPSSSLPAPSGPPFFDAVQQQWGLKLQPGVGPVDVFIVLSAERPKLD